MSYILTFVSSDAASPVIDGHITETMKLLGHYNIQQTCAPVWLHKHKAVDIGISEKPHSAGRSHIREFLDPDKIDFFITGTDKRRKKLLLADMDSTIVKGETLDELADYAGLKDKVSEITARAMEGELDFKSALRERVSLLKNLPAEALQNTLDRMSINPGAEKLVRVMSANKAECVLISGGFTFFTGKVAAQLKFHHHHGNRLKIEEQKLTGEVEEPILDKHAKNDFLKYYLDSLKIEAAESLAIGDGANDIPMLKAAGLGMGYKPKDTVFHAVENSIIHGDLTAALYAQGYTEQHLA